MRHNMTKKLRSISGESIAETLIALLISALALVMLAGAISTVARLVTTSNAKMAEYYAADSDLAERKGSETEEAFSVKIGENYEYDTTGYINSTFAGTPVVAYDAKPHSSSPSGG